MEYRVVIADDHPLVREALHQSLMRILPHAAVIEASGFDETLRAVDGDDIDLVLLDLDMPGMNGFTGLLGLRARHPAIPVAIVSGHQDISIARRSLRHGAMAFVPKTASVDEIGTAIRTVLDGDIWLPDWIRGAIEADGAAGSPAADRLARLTPQQLRVLNMLSEGKLNKQIAYELDVTEATVKAHVSAILRKLGAHSRTQAVIVARELEVPKSAIDV